MHQTAYRDLLRVARHATRRADEADDLVQDALLAAVAAGRTDFEAAATRAWMAGVIRNRAKMLARTAVRRTRRDTLWHRERPDEGAPGEAPGITELVAGLPPALKAVAMLALTGHSRREIAYLLKLPDTALRQRVVALKRALRRAGVAMPAGTPGLTLNLAYGRIRDALLPLLVGRGGVIASHDPDGHLFVLRGAHIAGAGGNREASNPKEETS